MEVFTPHVADTACLFHAPVQGVTGARRPRKFPLMLPHSSFPWEVGHDLLEAVMTLKFLLCSWILVLEVDQPLKRELDFIKNFKHMEK